MEKQQAYFENNRQISDRLSKSARQYNSEPVYKIIGNEPNLDIANPEDYTADGYSKKVDKDVL